MVLDTVRPSAIENQPFQDRQFAIRLPSARQELRWRRARLKKALWAVMPDWLYILYKCFLDFHMGHGAYPNILKPRSFSEKIQYRKLFDRRAILVKFADKFAVRDYVRERLGEDILPALYHVTEDPTDIPLPILPNRFVVKPTHGCGWIYIVRDKNTVDSNELTKCPQAGSGFRLPADRYVLHRRQGGFRRDHDDAGKRSGAFLARRDGSQARRSMDHQYQADPGLTGARQIAITRRRMIFNPTPALALFVTARTRKGPNSQ